MRTHLDLCSGIGGFALAARWAGLQTVGFVEIDPWCRRVLAHHWPEVPQHDDVKTITPATVADWLAGQRLDILTGGYPCQPFSHAGKRQGEDDARHLWPWIAALVSAVRPRWCLFENVAGHVSMGLDTVLSDLEAEGYACWPVVIPAAGVGAPHRRDRVWIIAHDERAVADASRRKNYGRGRGVLADSAAAWGRVNASAVAGGQTVADADDAGRGERWRSVTDAAEQPAAERGSSGAAGLETVGSVGHSADGLSGWLAGPAGGNPWAGDWERGVSRVTAGEADRRHKLKALGNAIVPQVAYQIVLAMLDAERQSV